MDSLRQSVDCAAPQGQSTDAPEPKTARDPKADSTEAEWSLQSPPPEGITIENLRKRGFDLLRLRIRGTRTSHSLVGAGVIGAALSMGVGYSADQWLVGGAIGGVALAMGVGLALRAAPGSWTITIVPDRLTIGNDRAVGSKSADTVLLFSEIQEIRIKKIAGGSRSALVLASNTASLTIGAGLSLQALEWLKNYLIMEVAGLTWRPIFEVGRKTTRKRSGGQTNILQDRPELARKIRTMFLEQAPPTMERLRAAVERKDSVGIKREAHWLKSSSANVGASHLSELYQLMEIHALNNDLAKVDLLGSDIDQEFASVQTWLNGLQKQEAQGGTFSDPPVSLPKFEIRSVSSPVSGTTTPAEPEKAAPIENTVPSKTAPPLFDARVLLVEDSAINQEVAAEFLRDLVSYVEFAEDGQQAVDAHWQGRFDLILMDCQMPGIDGFQATRLIRQRERNCELPPVPIIALTANALRGDRDKCLAAGMDDYISKPFAPETLRATVEKWLGQRKNVHRASTGAARHQPARAAAGSR
jgi:CheY-like chemotaxis protein/HPt (histidine-containing phosphotransfer) domain-containing protein